MKRIKNIKRKRKFSDTHKRETEHSQFHIEEREEDIIKILRACCAFFRGSLWEPLTVSAVIVDHVILLDPSESSLAS